MPQNVTITEIAGGMCAAVNFVVTYTVAPSTGSILSHRWEQRFHIREDDNQERVVEGTIQFATRATLTDMSDPDAWRMHVIPPYLAGFKREMMEFAVDSTGTKLKYMVRDVEWYRRPPVYCGRMARTRERSSGPFFTSR